MVFQRLMRIYPLILLTILLPACALFSKEETAVDGPAVPTRPVITTTDGVSAGQLAPFDLLDSLAAEKTAVANFGPPDANRWPGSDRPIDIGDDMPPPPAPTATVPPPPPPTSVPTPRPQPAADPTPVILSFTADVVDLEQGKRITFAWTTIGGVAARIYNGANSSMRFPYFWDVPANGTLTVEVSATRRKDPVFMLELFADESRSQVVREDLQLPWSCDLGYFFEPDPAICPREEAHHTWAAEQQFEGGRMVWVEDGDWIYVIFDEPFTDANGRTIQWLRFDDTWAPGEPETDPTLTPPAGLYQPERGFGKVWRENDPVRQQLGWALALEQGFAGAWQPWPADSDDVGGGGTYLRLADQQVAALSGFDSWGWRWFFA